MTCVRNLTVEEVVKLDIPISGDILEEKFENSELVMDLKEHNEELQNEVELLKAHIADAEETIQKLRDALIALNQELIDEKLYNAVGM